MKFFRNVSIMLMLVTLFIVMFGFGTIASAETQGALTYTISEDGKVTITAITTDEKEVVIPAEIDGKPVVAIEKTVFDGNKTLADVYFAGNNAAWDAFDVNSGEIRVHYEVADSKNHYASVVTAPTCKEDGYTTYSCVCGYEYTADKKSASHTFDNGKITAEPTCSEKGKIVYTCVVCNERFEEYIAIDPEKHKGDVEVRNAKDATCKDDGYTGDTYCLECKGDGDAVLIKAGEVIPATGEHVYNSNITKSATCNEKGSVTYICTYNCGDFYEEETDFDMTNHTGGTEYKDAVAATCIAEGYSGNKHCVGCGVKLANGESIAIDKTNHVGEFEIRDAIAATCGTEGYSGDKYCLACNEKAADGEAVPATGVHAFSVTTEKIATCFETGLKKHVCTVCSYELTEEVAIDATNHSGEIVIVGAKEADCGNDGYTGDKCCKDCMEVFEKGEVAPASGNHVYASAVTTPATCCEKGVVTYICAGCSDFYTQEIEKDSFNHTGGTETKDFVAATCISEGYTGNKHCVGCGVKLANGETIAIDKTNHDGETEIRDGFAEDCGNEGFSGNTYCLDCGEKIADGEVIPATGLHNCTDEITLVATCSAFGEKTYICTVCNKYTYTEATEKDPENHVGGTVLLRKKEADCGNNGYTGDVCCEGCEAVFEAGEVIPATNKHECESIVTKEPTCFVEGVEEFYCIVCDYKTEISIDIDPDNHYGGTYFVDTIDATCGTPGYEGDMYCYGCDAYLGEGALIEPTGWHNCDVDVLLEPTCNATGLQKLTCKVCDYVGEEPIEIDAENHVGEEELRNEKRANCSEKGYTGDICCSACGAVFEAGEETPVDAGKHEYSSDITVKATCCAKGVRTYTCRVCEDSFTEEVEMDPENHSGETDLRNTVDATCEKAGYSGDIYCKSCGGKVSDGVETAKAAHTEVVVEGKAATCTKTGLTNGTKCSVCQVMIKAHDVIAKIEHNYGDWTVVKAPTTKEKGTEQRICKVCRAKETREVDPLTYIVGDINNDGKINASDARLALRISAGLDTVEKLNAVFEAVDYNGDKKITAQDARLILRKSAGLDK